MGWRGTMRSLAAVSRQLDREAERRHKQAVRDQLTADAADAVADWESYIDELLTVHKSLAQRIDWADVLSCEEPMKPSAITRRQDAARQALKEFKPGTFDFLRGGSAKRKATLERALEAAVKEDEDELGSRLQEYREALNEWRADRELAQRLLAGDTGAIKEVIAEHQSLSSENLIGSRVDFSICEGSVHAKPQVHNDDIIPKFRRKQLASGKLSETKMPTGQFYELYQDYVSSVALKVASDLFQILPLDETYVTCTANMLNTSTGHQEPTPILSVQFVRATLENLNLEAIDPSDSISNFKHAMEFKKTKGFSAITPLVEE